MQSLFSSVESIALKVGTLTASLLVAEKTGIRDMILQNAGASDIGETVRYGAYLSASEWAGDMLATRFLGMRSVSLHQDGPWSFLHTFATNIAVYYVLEKTNVLDQILDQFGDGDVNRALANSIVYAIAQEVSYKLLSYWMAPTSADYGEKFQF